MSANRVFLWTLIILAGVTWWLGSGPDPREKAAWCGASGYFSKC